MKNLTITIEGVPDELLETGWVAAAENSPVKLLTDIRTDHIVFNVKEMDNKLASPLAEMMILAQTMHAIIAYQKQGN